MLYQLDLMLRILMFFALIFVPPALMSYAVNGDVTFAFYSQNFLAYALILCFTKIAFCLHHKYREAPEREFARLRAKFYKPDEVCTETLAELRQRTS